MGGSTSGKADALLLNFVYVRDVSQVVGCGGIIMGTSESVSLVIGLEQSTFFCVLMIIVSCDSPSFLKTGEMYEISLVFPPLYLLVK